MALTIGKKYLVNTITFKEERSIRKW
jgi:hypothetical protein